MLLRPTSAVANVAIGLSIFSRMLSRTFGTSLAPLWVTVAYDVFYVVFIIAGFVGFSVYACVTRQSRKSQLSECVLVIAQALHRVRCSINGLHNDQDREEVCGR